MDRVYEGQAAVGAPPVPSAPSTGYPHAGDPVSAQGATVLGPHFFHMVMEEMLAPIVAAGVTPDHTAYDQLLAALNAGWGMAKSDAQNGYVTLPGGVILQWGQVLSIATTTDATQAIVFPLAFPNNAWHAAGHVIGAATTYNIQLNTDSLTTTGVNLIIDKDSTSSATIGVGFFAIGS